jgi:hypothetical protein
MRTTVAAKPISGGEVLKKIPARCPVKTPRKIACNWKLIVPSARV